MKSSNENKYNGLLYVQRILDLPALIEKKSHFLFGPRQTGKTALIRRTLRDVKIYDLLDTSIFLALSQNPASGASLFPFSRSRTTALSRNDRGIPNKSPSKYP